MALITCPDCSKEISDAATACPNCGRPKDVGWTPPPQPMTIGQAIAADSNKHPGCVGCLGLIVIYAVFYVAFCGDGSKSTQVNPSPSPPPIEHLAASIDHGPQPAPAIVAEYSRLLYILAGRCGRSRDGISDMAAATKQRLEAAVPGKRVSMMDALVDFERGTRSLPTGTDCVSSFAAIAVLMEQE